LNLCNFWHLFIRDFAAFNIFKATWMLNFLHQRLTGKKLGNYIHSADRQQTD